jgi:hypothetical protein
MKLASLFAPCLLLLVAPIGRSQVTPEKESAIQSELRIAEPLEVSIFIPPETKVPEEMPPVLVEAAVWNRMKNGKVLHLARAVPSQLPDLAIVREELARNSSVASGELGLSGVIGTTETRQRFLLLGATVIDSSESHITWIDADGKSREALCGFDVSLLAGITNFRAGITDYSLLLMHGNHDSRRDGKFIPDAFADRRVKPGEIILGPGVDAESDGLPLDLALIRDLIAREKPRLELYQKARAERLDAELRWLDTNPVLPRDETIQLRPHSGSRYLSKANDADTQVKGEGK